MWQSTSIDRKKPKAPTTRLAGAPIIDGIAAIFLAALLAFPPMAQALTGYGATWNGVYAHSSGNNAACLLCHRRPR